ncbi:MAG: AgmX/PglI C-terminal domain-containing protein [Myxococcales bacterium FL481]|nr:MAG: AgmX/PglI C-terminal domain-containing protein [Myxococcales bacterium FL481]
MTAMRAIAFDVLPTYLLHSTAWFGAALAVELLWPRQPELRARVWQVAGLGGFASSAAAFAWALVGEGAALSLPGLRVEGGAPVSDGSGVPGSADVSAAIVAVSWAVVAAVLLARCMVQLVRVTRQLASRRPVVAPHALVALERAQAGMRMLRSVKLSESEAIMSPVALPGREVCLPRRAVEECAEPVLRGMLGHELHHVRRGDPALTVAFRLFHAIAWCQPLWWAFWRYRERAVESLCDDAGAHLVSCPRTMAEILVTVGQWSCPPAAGTTAFLGTRRELTRRVQSLLNPKPAQMGAKENVNMKLVPISLVAAALVLPTFSVSSAQEEAAVKGSLDKSDIREVVRANIGQVTACYNASLEKDPSVAGRISLAWTIESDGRVANSVVEESTLHNDELDACIVAATASWRFPAPDGGGQVKVSYPFELSTD